MFRWILLALIVALLAVATILVLAANYLPWWGFLLTLVGLVLAIRFGAPLLTGPLVRGLFSLPFRAKGAALRRAKAEIHEIAPATRPGAPNEGEAPTRLAFYRVDLTITPTNYTGPFKHWEPGELMLVPERARVDMESDDEGGIHVYQREVFSEGRFAPDEGLKYFGPQRLRLLLGVPPGEERAFAFRYYFEKFGKVVLPPVRDGDGDGDEAGDRSGRADRDKARS